MLVRVWPLSGMWDTFTLRISANPYHPVRWGKYCCPHFTDEETHDRTAPGLAQHCPTSKGSLGFFQSNTTVSGWQMEEIWMELNPISDAWRGGLEFLSPVFLIYKMEVTIFTT